MTTARDRVEHLALNLLPWINGSNKNGEKAHLLERGARNAAFEALMRLGPLLSDQTVLSMADRYLKQMEQPDAREFIGQMLLMMKRLLAKSETHRAMSKIIKKIGERQSEIVTMRQEFRDMHGLNPPTLVVLSPSMRCNLHCTGCYAGDYTKNDDLDPAIVDSVVQQARDMGMPLLTVSGGEPFFSEDTIRLWEKNPDILFNVYTNGTLINTAMAKRLAKMGNVLPAISVEGFEAETDARRGPGTYKKIMEAMDNLKREGVLFGFSATAVRGNNELISSPEFVDYYINKGCVIGWYFNYIPIGRAPNMDLMPTPEQRLARWRRVREMRRTKPILLADFWCDGTLTGGCIAGGKGYLHINNKGDAEPCVFVHFASDNVKEKSLAEILKSPLFTAIRARQPYSKNFMRPCMIIDYPQVLRDVVAEGGAKPSHPGAETVICQMCGDLDRYSEAYAQVADPVWEEEYEKEMVCNTARR